MEFAFKQAGQIGIFVLTGNLIGETDGIPLTDSFSGHVSDGINLYVIDLAGLQHINSTGLGVLITLLTKARKVDGEVVLASPSKFIRDLLVMTKLNTIFEIHEAQADAVEALSAKASQ
jgi:anti-sigma B factor antagonist